MPYHALQSIGCSFSVRATANDTHGYLCESEQSFLNHKLNLKKAEVSNDLRKHGGMHAKVGDSEVVHHIPAQPCALNLVHIITSGSSNKTKEVGITAAPPL